MTITGVTQGDFLGVTVTSSSVGGFSAYSIIDTMGNGFTPEWTGANTLSAAWWGTAKSTGSETITIGCTPGGCGFSGGVAIVDQFTAVSAVLGATYRGSCGSSCAANAGTDALQTNIVAGSGTGTWEPMIFVNSGSGVGVTLTPTSTSNDGIAPAPQTQNSCQALTAVEFCTFRSTNNANFPVYRVTWSGSGGSSGNDDHAVVILQGGSPAGTTQSSACFGNCGSPAITLVNSNATHTVNFNVSITLLYVFQSNVNGFIINATTNIGKPYVNGVNVGIGLYTANCQAAVTPFSPSCPGTLVTSKQNFVFNKGFDTTVSGVPITNGEWIAVAVTATFSGLDLNSTNAVCANFCFDSGHLQYASGSLPAVLSGINRCAVSGTACNTGGIDNLGLWAFVSGTTVTSIPPPTSTGCTNNFGQIDCMLPAMSNGLCNVVTVACQTSASLLWILILTLVVFFTATVGMSSAHITRFIGVGEIFLFVFLTWFFIFAGIGLIESFVVIMFLFTGAVAFGKTARNYF